MHIRLLGLALAGLLTACSGDDGQAIAERRQAARHEAVARPANIVVPRLASLADRGELFTYGPAGEAKHRGAYTWHPVQLSEDHALRSLATDGTLRITAPDGRQVSLRYERHEEHPDGNWTWFGRDPDGEDAVLTFGEKAVFGSIPNGVERPYRLYTQGGRIWLVATDRYRIAAMDNGARRTARPDFLIPPIRPQKRLGVQASAQAPVASAATAAAAPIVDVAMGYTAGFATALGGSSQALTRLNFLVSVANQAYANSQLEMRIRLVRALQVNYVDATDNEVALEELTGYRDGASIPVPAALQALRNAGQQYGADLVSLVRDFRTPENDGCGIAWLLGGGQEVVDQSWADFGYSVVSDGADLDEDDSENYFCRDETFVHELGHNMGSAHDRDTASEDDGVLDPEDYGRYAYSFGYKTDSANGNFHTVMAYGDTGQTSYRVFSNPRITICGGRACGAVNDDNARSLGQMAPVIASFRTSVVNEEEDAPTRAIAAGNFNGDGKYDIFWRNGTTGSNVIWRSASSTTQTAVTRVTDLRWQVATVGDFNADGRSDVLWRHTTSGKGSIWLSGSSATQRSITTVSNVAWEVAGAGDFNGDGRSDLVWRNYTTGGNAIWLSGDFGTQQAIASVTDTRWRIIGVGDFNADGRSDILWRHSSNGRNAVWLSGNGSTQQAVASVADLEWQPVGVGDFNGDGRDDILWRHAGDGRNTIWLAGNGDMQQAMAPVNDSKWRVASVGDFNGDGRSDILWRHASSGRNVIWRSGYSTAQQEVTSVTDLAWIVVG